MKRMIAAALMILLLLSVTACDKAPSKESTPLNAESKAATEITAQTNAEVYQLLDFDDEQEAEIWQAAASSLRRTRSSSRPKTA